ncbi:MAG: flagellar hook assembly protein FlgD [Deltaproteobacteria bacterium]|nr:flagellar hook assembly protein FlgD [Deltaproteobacteria bacterium]
METQPIVDLQQLTGYVPEESASGPADLLDRDVFLNLLVTQLRHQDPLNPMENQEFVDQLASLTTVEELRKSNDNLAALQLYESSINNAQSVSMIGKEVKALGNGVTLGADGEADVHYRLDAPAANVEITIFDDSGTVVRTIQAGAQKEGDRKETWNGADNNNSPLATGRYTFEVRATDAGGEEIGVTTFLAGRVSGVSFGSGGPELVIDGEKVMIGQVYEVNL